MKLVRACYGKKDTPEEMREYKIDGKGPVGTLSEFKEHFPLEEFEIVDYISNPIKCAICGKDIKCKGSWCQGNNAQPLADGRCCDECNEGVVEARFKLL